MFILNSIKNDESFVTVNMINYTVEWCYDEIIRKNVFFFSFIFIYFISDSQQKSEKMLLQLNLVIKKSNFDCCYFLQFPFQSQHSNINCNKSCAYKKSKKKIRIKWQSIHKYIQLNSLKQQFKNKWNPSSNWVEVIEYSGKESKTIFYLLFHNYVDQLMFVKHLKQWTSDKLFNQSEIRFQWRST